MSSSSSPVFAGNMEDNELIKKGRVSRYGEPSPTSAQCYERLTTVTYGRKVCRNVIKYFYSRISRQKSHLAAKIRA